MNVQRLLHYLWQNISLDESLGGGAESPTHISRPYLQGSVLKRLALMSRPKRSARLCRSAINDGHYLRSLPFKHKIKLFLSAYNYRIRKREKKNSPSRWKIFRKSFFFISENEKKDDLGGEKENRAEIMKRALHFVNRSDLTHDVVVQLHSRNQKLFIDGAAGVTFDVPQQ